jgi:hypothetical protein
MPPFCGGIFALMALFCRAFIALAESSPEILQMIEYGIFC